MKIDREAIGHRIIGEMKLRGAFGRANAIPRVILLDVINQELHAFIEEDERRNIKDVEFRSIYRFLPICACDEGLYFPVTAEDIEAFRVYMKAKAVPLFDRVKRIAEAYPDLVRDPRQLSLEI